MKKLWKQNRVLFVLVCILVVCFVAIVTVTVTFFYSRNTSKYGDRLEKIEKYPIKEKFKSSYKSSMLDIEGISKVNITVIGRVIYINFNVSGVSLNDMKTHINESLKLFDEKILSYYDVEFTIVGDDYKIIGAKNAIVDHISWNNNTPFETEVDKKDETE